MIPESREERASGLLRTGEMSSKRFGEHIDVAHGTVKRWLLEGLPCRHSGNRVWITPSAGIAWIEGRYGDTISRSRRGLVYIAVRARDGAEERTESEATKLGTAVHAAVADAIKKKA